MQITCPHCEQCIQIGIQIEKGSVPDSLMKLRLVEQELRKFFAADRAPTRGTILNWIKEGRLRAIQIGRGHNYYVWESSLDRLKQKLNTEAMSMAA